MAPTISWCQGVLDFLDDEQCSGCGIKKAVIRELDGAIFLLVDTQNINPWGKVGTIYKSTDNGGNWSRVADLVHTGTANPENVNDLRNLRWHTFKSGYIFAT